MNTQYLGRMAIPSQALPLPHIEAPRVQAGFPSPAADFIEATLDLNTHLITNPIATFFLIAQGDSMEDAHIFDADILVVDRSVRASRGRVVVASLHGGDHLHVKKLGVSCGLPALLSCNAARADAYPPIPLNDDGAEIWGVVIAVVRKL